MRKLFGTLVAGALLLGASLAQAAPVQTTANLVVDLGPLGSFTVTGVGTVDVMGSGGPFSAVTTGGASIDGTQIAVPAGLVSLAATTTISLTPNQTTLVSKIRLQPGVGNASGTFMSNFVPIAGEQCPPTGNEACVVGGGNGGIVPIIGGVTAFLAGGTPVGVDLANFGIGEGGGVTAGLIVGEGAPFTTQTGLAATVNGNISSAVGRAAEPITFVTPVALDALGNGLALFVSFSLDEVNPVPEPGWISMFGAGMVGLLIASRLRR